MGQAYRQALPRTLNRHLGKANLAPGQTKTLPSRRLVRACDRAPSCTQPNSDEHVEQRRVFPDLLDFERRFVHSLQQAGQVSRIAQRDAYERGSGFTA